MIKDLIKEQQPIVYKALVNARKEGRLSHAYLFTGPRGTVKNEAAILLAQSIFCEKQDVLACEHCDTCRRVAEGEHADMMILSGQNQTIKKEDIDRIQKKFSKTALEASGKKVYIIDHLENANASAMNSMLKFLEEPAPDLTAILLCDSIDRILPTILSRCTILPFVPVKASVYYEEAVKEGIAQDDAYFLSRTAGSIRAMHEYLDEKETDDDDLPMSKIYEKAKEMFMQYLNKDGSRDELLIDYNLSIRFQNVSISRKKADGKEKKVSADKKCNMQLLIMFFDLLSMFYHDVILGAEEGPEWYQKAIQEEKKKSSAQVRKLQIAHEERDLCNLTNDLNLIMDQAMFRLEEAENE